MVLTEWFGRLMVLQVDDHYVDNIGLFSARLNADIGSHDEDVRVKFYLKEDSESSYAEVHNVVIQSPPATVSHEVNGLTEKTVHNFYVEIEEETGISEPT